MTVFVSSAVFLSKYDFFTLAPLTHEDLSGKFATIFQKGIMGEQALFENISKFVPVSFWTEML